MLNTERDTQTGSVQPRVWLVKYPGCQYKLIYSFTLYLKNQLRNNSPFTIVIPVTERLRQDDLRFRHLGQILNSVIKEQEGAGRGTKYRLLACSQMVQCAV